MPDQDWDKLRRDADQGMNGLGSLVEAIRRMDEASGRLSRQMLNLTYATVILTLVQAVAACVGIWLALRPAGH
jgi:hypothetical protein